MRIGIATAALHCKATLEVINGKQRNLCGSDRHRERERERERESKVQISRGERVSE